MNENPLDALRGARSARIDEHAELRKSPEWQAEIRRHDRMFRHFVRGVHYCWIAASRSTLSLNNSLVLRHTDDLLQTAIVIRSSVENGAQNPARREQRYALESLVHFAYVDQENPQSSLDERLEFYKHNVEKSDLKKLEHLKFFLLSDVDAQELKSELNSEYSRLCRYVHPSTEQLRASIDSAAEGRPLGFERVESLAALNRDVFRLFDVLLALYFHGVGRDASGDAFVQALDSDPDWKFHKGKFTKRISQYFDYKAERNDRGA
jgi:hypothetical protein